MFLLFAERISNIINRILLQKRWSNGMTAAHINRPESQPWLYLMKVSCKPAWATDKRNLFLLFITSPNTVRSMHRYVVRSTGGLATKRNLCLLASQQWSAKKSVDLIPLFESTTVNNKFRDLPAPGFIHRYGYLIYLYYFIGLSQSRALVSAVYIAWTLPRTFCMDDVCT